MVVESSLPLQFPETPGPHIIMTVERVVPAELVTTITTSTTLQGNSREFNLPHL